MPDIVLATLNARYWHTSFGLRYLLANMEELAPATVIREFGINDRPVDMISTILAAQPRIVGLGIYIWNVEAATHLVADLKRVRPDIILILGGPEVSYETKTQPIVHLADYVITGEADIEFPALCRRLLVQTEASTTKVRDTLIQATADCGPKVIHAAVPSLDAVRMPYELYTDDDIAHRVIYVEVSRGCPFTCEFCLSALDVPVRLFDVDKFLKAMQSLLERGVHSFKFVDRTFNLNMRVSRRILQFFLDRCEAGLFLHFEMIPDRLPESLRDLIVQFPAGVLQFEIGVQTFDHQVGESISRQQNNDKLSNNFRFLRQESGVHIHADLIVGLPGESVESFAAGFDRLVELNPQEIQIGILKRLKGTPIIRHDAEWKMIYSAHPPFEILSNRLIDFETMHRLRRMARFWDLVANSGNFVHSCPLIWQGRQSAFDSFLQFSDWLFQVEQRSFNISLIQLADRLFQYLTAHLPDEDVAATIWRDYVRSGRKDKPHFLRAFDLPPPHEVVESDSPRPSRQARHVR
ncbi:MAG: DUF4080 domain-containing protein [Fuerstiella sp.]|nr:DUF4080 domain-containing protein [Fuerstiella sp.]MCP4508152.1 DUF4080 domain-containing protein [Fuerstiella sp.]